jgi:hypothetical protein
MPLIALLGSIAMHTLGPDAFAQAANLIVQTGRPLERAQYALQFAHGTRAAVIAEVEKFQNSDGGFAAYLESDNRWQGSSATATMMALRLFDQMGAAPDDVHVRAAVSYLLSTFDQSKGYWHALPIESNTAPHAPWWDVHADSGKCDVESPVFPTAAIAAHLRAYATLLPPGFLDRITRSSIKYLADSGSDIAMPDIEMLIELVQRLPDDQRGDSIARLRQVLSKAVVRDPQQWKNYGIQPTTFVAAPESPFFAGLEADISANLDYILATQKADGGWDPNWSWSDVNASAWELARREWRAALTLQNLKKLQAFHRISGR